jgi:uncharacterized protein
MMRFGLVLLLTTALAGGGFFMSDSLSRQMLYPAPAVPVPSPPPAPLAEVWLEPSTGERVLAWAWTEGVPEGAPLVLLFHGNGENLETMRQVGVLEELRDLGAALLAVEYPGYGRSSGRPSEQGLFATGEAAVAWAREHHPERPLVVCGWSLGAAVAIALAARHPGEIEGLIALSPWTTVYDVAKRFFPAFLLKALLREKYDSLAAAREVRVPALVIHGERDQIIPVELGREVAKALPSGRWVPVPSTGHNDLLARPAVWEEMRRFLAGL